jgi:hypothetical protein
VSLLWDCHLRFTSLAIPGGEAKKKRLFYRHSSGDAPPSLQSREGGREGEFLKASFGRSQKNKTAASRQPFIFGVEDGIRTHDLRNHNPTF